jgi:hypothetical protein
LTAFEIHGPASMGFAGVPGNVIKFAVAAENGFGWLHGNGFF